MPAGCASATPHDVRLLDNGHLLIVDPARDVVVEVDWSGWVFRQVGGGESVALKDPHSAQMLPDGTVLIADTGHDRVLWADTRGGPARALEFFRDGTTYQFLSGPRYAELTADGLLVVADTGNNRVLAGTPDGALSWQVSSIPGSRLATLNQPRWVHVPQRGGVLICDHGHHRVVHLKKSAAPA